LKQLNTENASRPGISYAVSLLTKYLDSPHLTHMKAARHILITLYTTRSLKLNYCKIDELVDYNDSDQGGDIITCNRYATTIVTDKFGLRRMANLIVPEPAMSRKPEPG
jgi:hypothetical protein